MYIFTVCIPIYVYTICTYVPLFIYICKCVVVVTVHVEALNVTFSGQRFVLRAKLKTCFGVFILVEFDYQMTGALRKSFNYRLGHNSKYILVLISTQFPALIRRVRFSRYLSYFTILVFVI